MHITDLLLKYRQPLFSPEGEGGSGGDAAPAAPAAPADGAAPAEGADAPKTALTGDAPADDADAAPDADDKGDDAGGDDKDADDAAKKDDDAGEGDDASGDFKLTAPEGMENFQEEFDTFSSEASEWMQANPEATPSEALKWAADRQAAAVATQTQDMSESFIKQIDTWEDEARKDKDIGGDAYDENLAVAKKAIDAFGDGDLKAVLNESGLGSHPAVIRFALNAGKSLGDAPVLKTNAGDAKKTLAEALYGKD